MVIPTRSRMRTDKDIIDEARLLPAVMSIGKNGITEGSVKLLQRELDQKRLVKVKLLPNYLRVSGRDRREVAEQLASLSGGRLVQVVGNVVLLYK